MKNLRQTQFIFAIALAFSFLLYSCTPDPIEKVETKKDYKVIVTTTNSSNTQERNLVINGATAGKSIPVKVTFQSEKGHEMKRMYITKLEANSTQGAIPFAYNGAKTKKDGSIDLTGETGANGNTDLNLTITPSFPTPSEANSTVVYKLWVTETKITSRGDFRDPSKRNAISKDPVAFATITINSGTAAGSIDDISSDGSIKHFSAVLLRAPALDGSSQTFISLFNSKVYKISDGKEYASLWDFGYYYLKTITGATLASASNYNDEVVNITKLTGLEKSELNNFYFRLSTTIDKTKFDAISNADEMNFTKPSAQVIGHLKADDIIEFKDAYGKSGLIKVIEVKEGYSPENDYIKLEIKMKK